MALTSVSLLPIKTINNPSSASPSSSCCNRAINPLNSLPKSSAVVNYAEPKKWKALVSTALAAALITFSSDMSALADLNKYEADIRGEFGIGSAAQFGSADLRKALGAQPILPPP